MTKHSKLEKNPMILEEPFLGEFFVFFHALTIVIIWYKHTKIVNVHLKKSKLIIVSIGKILKQCVKVMIFEQFIVGLGLRLSSPISCMYVLKQMFNQFH